MQNRPSNQSKKIRNRIILTFLAGILLIISFGIIIFNLSLQTTQDIDASSKGLTHGINVAAANTITDDASKSTRAAFLFLTLGSVLFIYLMFNMMFSITPALRRITTAVKAIGDGDLDYRLNLPQSTELGEVALALNWAMDKVSEGERSLKKEKAGVERLVEKRTKELKIEEGKFLASINGLPLGFILTDNKGHILMLNPAMERILNLHGDINLDELAKKVASQESLLTKIIDKSAAAVKHKNVTSVQLIDEGKYFHVLYSPISISDKELGGVVILVEDITEAKIMERSKDEFFSIASHELRTPLTAIRGNSSMIEQFYLKDAKDPELSSMVEDIHSSSIRLIGIVNDFLDASRLEQGAIALKSQVMKIEDVVNTVLKEINTVAQEKHLYVKADLASLKNMPPVFADPERVEQVLFNLIGNALKFVTEGGVTLQAHVEDNKLKVFVSDTGRGISLKNQQLLFHKFQQANTSLLTRDTTKGTGLGLYISKLLIKEMGGNLKLEESEEGKGSTFSFTLPLATKKDLAKASTSKPTPPVGVPAETKETVKT